MRLNGDSLLTIGFLISRCRVGSLLGCGCGASLVGRLSNLARQRGQSPRHDALLQFAARSGHLEMVDSPVAHTAPTFIYQCRGIPFIDGCDKNLFASGPSLWISVPSSPASNSPRAHSGIVYVLYSYGDNEKTAKEWNQINTYIIV